MNRISLEHVEWRASVQFYQTGYEQNWSDSFCTTTRGLMDAKAPKILLQTFLNPMQNLFFMGSRFESVSTLRTLLTSAAMLSDIYQNSIAKAAYFIIQIFKNFT
jgi:hypothetical protein